MMENVEEWKDWGLLIEMVCGLMFCLDWCGKMFEVWCKVICKLGGKIEWCEFCVCDYGVLMICKWLFVVIWFDGKIIVWLEFIYGDLKSEDVIVG